MISIIFSDDPTLNKRINRIISILTIVGFLGAGTLWTYNLLEPIVATETEVQACDKESMDKHNAENSLEQWADNCDVNHISNLLVEAQLDNVQADIAWYEGEAKERALTTNEAKILGGLLQRKTRLEKSFIPESGALHSHGGEQ